MGNRIGDTDSDQVAQVFDGMNDAVLVHDEDGSFTFANQAAIDRYGLEDSDLSELTPWDIVVPEEGENVSDRIDRIKEEGELVFETKHQLHSGEVIPVEISASPISFRGSPSILSIVREISERREQERELRDLKNRYQSFVEYSSDIITVIDQEGKIAYQNPAVDRLFGFDPSDRVGDRVFEYVHPEDRERVLNKFDDLLGNDVESSERVEMRYQDPDGSYRWLESIAVDRTDTEIDGLLVYSRDITDRKEREAELEQYKQAVESSKELIAAVDEDLHHLFANQAYRNFFDFDDKPITSQTVENVVEASEFKGFATKIQSALNGRPVQIEFNREHPKKGECILDARLFPLEKPNGDIYGVGVSMRDITEQKERKAAIERESEIRRLFSEVNHTLVRGDGIENVMTEITEILGTSSLFECTFSYLTDVQNSVVVCSYESNLTASDAKEFHSELYLDRVFTNSLLEIEDVTEPSYAHHPSEVSSHPGIAVPIAHEGERYGVLTVHLPPGETATPEVKEFLKTISADIGFFTFNQLLRSEHKSFAEIVQRIDDPVMIQNLDGSFRVINEAVIDMAMQSQETLIGQDEFAFMDEAAAEKIDEKKKRVAENEESVSYQVSPAFPDGSERTFSTTRYPYYDEQGNLDGTIAICRDVTDLEEHKRHLEILDRVLRHNLNQNMTVVQGYASMIETQTEGAISENAAKITNNATKILEVSQKQRKITEFLSESPSTEEIEIGSIVKRLAKRVETEYPDANISIGAIPEVQVTAINAIEEAIEELLVNSIVHSEQSKPSVTVKLETTGDTVRIKILDENPQLIEMDYAILEGKTKLGNLHHGSGLGLWLVRLIVDRAKGKLHYKPNEPRGNVVTIELRRRDS